MAILDTELLAEYNEAIKGTIRYVKVPNMGSLNILLTIPHPYCFLENGIIANYKTDLDEDEQRRFAGEVYQPWVTAEYDIKPGDMVLYDQRVKGKIVPTLWGKQSTEHIKKKDAKTQFLSKIIATPMTLGWLIKEGSLTIEPLDLGTHSAIQDKENKIFLSGRILTTAGQNRAIKDVELMKQENKVVLWL